MRRMFREIRRRSDVRVGIKVRHLRWMQEMPREVLSERMGMPVERLRRCESGALSFSVDELERIAGHLAVPFEFFEEAMNDDDQIGIEDVIAVMGQVDDGDSGRPRIQAVA